MLPARHAWRRGLGAHGFRQEHVTFGPKGVVQFICGRVSYFTRFPAPKCHEWSFPEGRACHDTAAITGQFALAGRELVNLRLARLCRLFNRAADIGGYSGRRDARHLMARLAPLKTP